MGDDQRVTCCTEIADISVIGEQLRLKMHENEGLIRDRRYLFKNYATSIQGAETVEWLVRTEQAPDANVAVILMNILLDNQIIHHVNDSQSFKNDSQLYRFRKDDGTFPDSERLVTYLRAVRQYRNLLGVRQASIVGDNLVGNKLYAYSFLGSEFVEWLVENNEVCSQEYAIKTVDILVRGGVIREVNGSQVYEEGSLYQYTSNFGRDRILLDLVLPPPEVEVIPGEASYGPKNPDGSDKAKDIPDGICVKRPDRTESGYHSDHQEGGHSSSSGSSPDLFSSRVPGVNDSIYVMPQTGVLLMKVTAKDLLTPRDDFQRKQLRIASDAVGFGLVIRGDGPCYVKTVDPLGPGAAAGLKVGQYLFKVNERLVVNMNHQDLAHVILENPAYVNIVVMEYIGELPIQP
ncbi:hypothetical protein CAPTEDRAFT_180920 [Capitella teleta]|uniref:DEP domain-containing protein n=1 Tax=Capitella teleta TaxID=283909 RepID=R7UF86_CAPTE|nr:hypothetical protein CAPTEDRAFT_180920 [Capitella teleta]|eukprot:ELU05204.1 hypothetical protein CAPTEDRAFT_180920 [Capitella teleta]